MIVAVFKHENFKVKVESAANCFTGAFYAAEAFYFFKQGEPVPRVIYTFNMN